MAYHVVLHCLHDSLDYKHYNSRNQCLKELETRAGSVVLHWRCHELYNTSYVHHHTDHFDYIDCSTNCAVKNEEEDY